MGRIEVDESYYFGAKGKIIVFGLLKRGGKVDTEIIDDCSVATLQSIIKGKTRIDSVIHCDGWREYHGLVDFSYQKPFRVHHGKNEFARGNSHINGIESFWAYAKMRLNKLRGINKNNFE